LERVACGGWVANGRFESADQTEQTENPSQKSQRCASGQHLFRASWTRGEGWAKILGDQPITLKYNYLPGRGKIAAHFYQSPEPPSKPSRRTVLSQLPRVSTMEAKSQQLNEREGAISALNAAIEALNLAKISSIPPTKAVFGSVVVLLTLIRVCFLLFCCDLLQVHT
jgi:hypothetical protein